MITLWPLLKKSKCHEKRKMKGRKRKRSLVLRAEFFNAIGVVLVRKGVKPFPQCSNQATHLPPFLKLVSVLRLLQKW